MQSTLRFSRNLAAVPSLAVLGIVSMCLSGCNREENATETTESSKLSLPTGKTYVEFLPDGGLWSPAAGTITARAAGANAVIMDSLEFKTASNEVFIRLSSDSTYAASIPSVLDYACPKLGLALLYKYGAIVTAKGDTLFSLGVLKNQCEDIGYKGANKDDSGNVDPMLVSSVAARAAEVVSNETPGNGKTVEIYPYQMYANVFRNDYYVYASAGAETQFKKRQRVVTWRGMRWRWDSFDPDRTGVRSYCVSVTSAPGADKPAEFKLRSSSTAYSNTWYESTDYVAERCDISFLEAKAGVAFDCGKGCKINYGESGDMYGFDGFAVGYKGGIIGMHYVHHGNMIFRAITTRELPSNTFLNTVRSKLQYAE